MPAPTVTDVLADLVAEQDALDRAISGLDDATWQRRTASPGWTIADQVGHLAFFDDTASLAIADPDAFTTHASELFASFTDPASADEATLGRFRRMDARELQIVWRQYRSALAKTASTLTDDDRVVWYGPSMGSKSFLTARLMECWAHGQDIIDAAGLTRVATDRLQHIARLGFNTRSWTYLNRKLAVPDEPVGVTLTSPSGAEWIYGDIDATQYITGSAEDFCLVVTQRRHVDDTALTVRGDLAYEWMVMAQAFAGPASDGPSANTPL